MRCFSSFSRPSDSLRSGGLGGVIHRVSFASCRHPEVLSGCHMFDLCTAFLPSYLVPSLSNFSGSMHASFFHWFSSLRYSYRDFLGQLVIYSSMESAMNYHILYFCVFWSVDPCWHFFALMFLQSTHMASQQITEEAVYLCTGNPLPKDIEQISYWLLNEKYSESFKSNQDYFKPFINVFSISITIL